MLGKRPRSSCEDTEAAADLFRCTSNNSDVSTASCIDYAQDQCLDGCDDGFVTPNTPIKLPVNIWAPRGPGPAGTAPPSPTPSGPV